jgi:hypothetical protein
MSRGYPIVSYPGLGVNAKDIDASWRTFVPQVMLIGAGTAPNYVTNQGRFMAANNVVRCDILLDGNGGTPGSGAGVINVSLPATPSPLRLGAFLSSIGYALNNANYTPMAAILSTGSPWLPLAMWATASSIAPFTGADQNNAIRTIRLHFWYECELLL